MKKTLFLLLLHLSVFHAFAQKTVEKHLPYKTGQTAYLNLKFADSIQVRYWDKPEVYVKIRAVINNNKLNDALVISEKKSADEVGLEIDFDQEKIKAGEKSDCPGTKYGTWRSDKDGPEYFLCKEINYQVFLPKNAVLKLETIDGNIDIQGASASVNAKTISGFVDFTWPDAKGANVALQTITGEVYSDLDIAFTKKREKNPIVGYLLEGTVSGGGPVVKLESISNNVYLRSRK